MKETSDLAIVGAGAAGLAAAWQCSRYGLGSTVFEKSRGLSGRAATRRQVGSHFDHGTNFFRLEDSRVDSLLTKEVSAEGLVQIPGEVWTFDREGQITPGDPEQNAVPKWTYEQGVSMLGKHLLAASPLTKVHREVRLERISREGQKWILWGDQGSRLGDWSHLLLTPPPPQVADILNASQLAPELAEALAAISYHPQFTLVLAFQSPVLERRPFHALVNTDGQHPVAWLSFEEDKVGHVTHGGSVLIAQMSPAWTLEHYEKPPEDWRGEVVNLISALLDFALPEPIWWNCQRWRYAHPKPGPSLSPEIREEYEEEGLFLAGDGMMGKGRLPLALLSGLEVADRIFARHSRT